MLGCVAVSEKGEKSYLVQKQTLFNLGVDIPKEAYLMIYRRAYKDGVRGVRDNLTEAVEAATFA